MFLLCFRFYKHESIPSLSIINIWNFSTINLESGASSFLISFYWSSVRSFTYIIFLNKLISCYFLCCCSCLTYKLNSDTINSFNCLIKLSLNIWVKCHDIYDIFKLLLMQVVLKRHPYASVMNQFSSWCYGIKCMDSSRIVFGC